MLGPTDNAFLSAMSLPLPYEDPNWPNAAPTVAPPLPPTANGGNSPAFGAADPAAPANKRERYLLAAADQKDGPRDERLASVIKAKLDAGLIKPCVIRCWSR